jgi:hypothetical protein
MSGWDLIERYHLKKFLILKIWKWLSPPLKMVPFVLLKISSGKWKVMDQGPIDPRK